MSAAQKTRSSERRPQFAFDIDGEDRARFIRMLRTMGLSAGPVLRSWIKQFLKNGGLRVVSREPQQPMIDFPFDVDLYCGTPAVSLPEGTTIEDLLDEFVHFVQHPTETDTDLRDFLVTQLIKRRDQRSLGG